MRRRLKVVADSALHKPLLTHMRAVAYAPVVLPESKGDATSAMSAADTKRARRAERRLREQRG